MLFTSIFAAAACVADADNLSGHWEGSEPEYIFVEATFDGSAKGHINMFGQVVADRTHEHTIDCTTEDIAEDDSQITFPSVGTIGDCLGDGVRTSGGLIQDPTKVFLIKNSDGTLTFKCDLPDCTVLMKKKSVEVQDTCSLYEIASDAASCGQSDLDCKYTKYAKVAEKGLVDGTCASQGYTVETGTTTKTYPLIGDIVVTQFSKGLEVQDTCSLYEIASDASSCGQSDLDCKYTKYAKVAEKGLVDGTCASQGYTVETGTTTKTYPLIGDIVVTQFSKAMLV